MLSSITKQVKGFATRNEAHVLVYHAIADKTLPYRVWTHMEKDNFEKHIRYVSENYNCISVAELGRAINRKRLKKNTVVITLDDGFASNLYRALPIFEKYGVPATIFVSSGFTQTGELIWPDKINAAMILCKHDSLIFDGVTYDLSSIDKRNTSRQSLIRVFKEYHPSMLGRKADELCDIAGVSEQEIKSSDFYDDIRMMNVDELRKLASSELIEIGAHTVNHVILSRLDEAEAQREIVESKRQLEEMVGKITSFAYPHGGSDDYSDIHKMMLKQAGFNMIFTAIKGTVTNESDPFELNRIPIGSESSVGQLEYMLHGGVSFDEAEHPAYHLMKGLFTGVSH